MREGRSGSHMKQQEERGRERDTGQGASKRRQRGRGFKSEEGGTESRGGKRESELQWDRCHMSAKTNTLRKCVVTVSLLEGVFFYFTFNLAD